MRVSSRSPYPTRVRVRSRTAPTSALSRTDRSCPPVRRHSRPSRTKHRSLSTTSTPSAYGRLGEPGHHATPQPGPVQPDRDLTGPRFRLGRGTEAGPADARRTDRTASDGPRPAGVPCQGARGAQRPLAPQRGHTLVTGQTVQAVRQGAAGHPHRLAEHRVGGEPPCPGHRIGGVDAFQVGAAAGFAMRTSTGSLTSNAADACPASHSAATCVLSSSPSYGRAGRFRHRPARKSP